MKALYEEYDKIYTRKEHYRNHYSKSPYKRIWLKVKEYIQESDTVIEFGCGTGQLMQLLLEKGIKKYIGYDFSQIGINLAKEKIGQSNAEILYQDLYELQSLPDADVYIAVEVLEHLRDDNDKRLLSLIRYDKKVIITVPNYLGGSHVRKFDTKEEIIERYNDIIFKEITEIGSLSKIFICFGKKK